MGILDLFKSKKINISIGIVENNNSKLVFDIKSDALTQVFNAYSFYGEEKHIFNNKIIENYSSSDNPNDVLAVAISYLGEGYTFRKQAIDYFERYLKCPSNQKYFSNWFIYSSLATLYEQEYMFQEALACLQILIKLDNNSNYADYTRIGNVLTKIDINKAVIFYENLQRESFYKNYKDVFDKAYKEALLKQKKGYKFKPRKNKKELESV